MKTNKPRHPERSACHPERSPRHPERSVRHPERSPRHPERSEGSRFRKILRCARNDFLTLLLLTICAAARAGDDPKLQRADEIYAALFADAMVRPDDKHKPELDRSHAIDARFGYHAEQHWGCEVRAFYGPLSVKAGERNGNRSGLGGDAVYRFGPLLGVRPYVLAGVGVAYSDRLPGADWIAPYVNVGVGLSSGTLVELWQRPLRLRAEVRYAYEDYRDDYTSPTDYDPSNYLDLHAFLGLEFGLRRHVPEPPPPKPEVVP